MKENEKRNNTNEEVKEKRTIEDVIRSLGIGFVSDLTPEEYEKYTEIDPRFSGVDEDESL